MKFARAKREILRFRVDSWVTSTTDLLQYFMQFSYSQLPNT